MFCLTRFLSLHVCDVNPSLPFETPGRRSEGSLPCSARVRRKCNLYARYPTVYVKVRIATEPNQASRRSNDGSWGWICVVKHVGSTCIVGERASERAQSMEVEQ